MNYLSEVLQRAQQSHAPNAPNVAAQRFGMAPAGPAAPAPTMAPGPAAMPPAAMPGAVMAPQPISQVAPQRFGFGLPPQPAMPPAAPPQMLMRTGTPAPMPMPENMMRQRMGF